MSEYKKYDYGYDYEDELDESLSFGSRDFLSDIRSRERDAQRRKTLVDMYNAFSGTRQYMWTLKIPGGGEAQGKILIPMDEAPHPDLATKRAFEVVFGSVKAVHHGKGRFDALVEGRRIGAFVLDPQTVQREVLDAFGRPSYQARPGEAQRQWEHAAMGWLRRNIEFTLSDGRETYPKYEPAMPSRSKGRPLAEEALHWYREMAAQRPPKPAEEPWTKVTNGKNTAAIGVNLSVAAGGGATNLAFATQLEDTARRGKRPEEIGNSGRIYSMHKEGKVIG